MNERDLFGLLETRYSGSDWMLVPQVPNGTGRNKDRTADAVAMSLWPSRGLELHGFELKVTRADWLKELNGRGAKAEAIGQYCDRWWVVVSEAAIVKDNELPKSWGLLVKRGETLFAKVQAPLNPGVKPIDRAIMSGMVRASFRYHASLHSSDEHERAVHDAYDRGRKDGLSRSGSEEKNSFAKLQKLVEAIDKFQQASGISIDSYTDGEELGKRVAAAKYLEADSYRFVATQIERAASRLNEIKTELFESIADAMPAQENQP